MTRQTFLLCLLVTLCGCRFSDLDPPPAWSSAVQEEPALPAPQPAPYRVGVLLPRFEFDARELHRDDETRHSSHPDALGFRRELVEALRAGELFARAEPRGVPGSERAQIEGEAWSAHDDLLLEVEFLDYHQAFLGHGDGYVPWLLTYVFWIWPAWWMPGESFGVGADLRVRLRDVQGRHEPLVDEVIRITPAESSLTLTPTERDWAGFLDLGALWNIQASLKPANWSAVERWIGPRARRLLSLRLLRLLRAKVTEPLTRENPILSARVRKRLGLVVGVSEGSDPRVGGAAFAEEDAATIAKLWSSPAGGGLVPGRDLTTLRGEQATRSDVLAGIAAIGSQTSASDEVIVYLSAQGTTGEAGASLLLFDANLDDLPGSSLSLTELGAALRALPAQRVLLILDASFAQPGPGTRTWRGTQAAPSDPELQASLALGAQGAVIFAARPTQGAHVIAEGEAGLFTQVFKEGIEGRADADGDARTTLRELCAYLQLEVPGRAGLERHEQTPYPLGLPDLAHDQQAPDDQIAWPR